MFRLKYDYHNIKTLLKAPAEAERLLIDAGTIPAEDMRRRFAESGGWAFLPPDMAAAAQEAQRVLAETGSARSSDCILDRAYFARLQGLADDSRLPYLVRREFRNERRVHAVIRKAHGNVCFRAAERGFILFTLNKS